MGSDTQREVGDLVAVGTVDRGDQASAARRHELDCLIDAAVGHEGRHRAERLGGVDHRGPGISGQQQGGGHERSGHGVDAGEVAGVHYGHCGLTQRAHRGGHIVALGKADEWTHAGGPGAGIAHGHSPQRLDEGLGSSIQVLFRYERSADGGALLTGLDRHLLDNLGREQVELGGAGGGRWSQHRRIERVSLNVESCGPGRHGGMGPQRGCGGSRAGEGDAVLTAEAVEQAGEFGGRGTRQLQRSLGK